MADINAIAEELWGTKRPAGHPSEALATELWGPAGTMQQEIAALRPLTPFPTHQPIGPPGVGPGAPVPIDAAQQTEDAMTLGQRFGRAGKGVTAAAIQTGATAGGFTLGSLSGPAAPVLGPVLGALGNEAGYKLNQYFQLVPGDPMSFTREDAANLVAPLAAGAPGMAKKGVQTVEPLMPAGKAKADAAKQTTENQTAYEQQLGEWLDPRTWPRKDPRPTPPEPVKPTIQEGGDHSGPYRRLGEVALSTLAGHNQGHTIKAMLVGMGLAAADKNYMTFNKWLVSPEGQYALQHYRPLASGSVEGAPSGYATLGSLSTYNKDTAVPEEQGSPWLNPKTKRHDGTWITQ